MLGKRFLRSTSMSLLGSELSPDKPPADLVPTASPHSHPFLPADARPDNVAVSQNHPNMSVCLDDASGVSQNHPNMMVCFEHASGDAKGDPNMMVCFEHASGDATGDPNMMVCFAESSVDASPHNVVESQNDPNIMCFRQASFAQPDVCMHGEVEIANPTLPSPSPLIPPLDSSLQVPLAVGIQSNVDDCKSLAQEGVSHGQAVFPNESQMQEWHQYSPTSSASDVSFGKEGPYRANSMPPVDFLDACYFCKKRLGPGLDIYMYRGDRAFCSVECRHHQIVIDERREKASQTTAKRASGMTTPVRHANHSGNVVPTGTAAAA